MAKNPFSGSIDVSSLVQILQEVTNGTKSVASAEEELQKAYKKTVAEVKKLEKAQKELNDTRNINAQLSELKNSLNQIQDALKKVGTNSTGTTKGFKSMDDALKSINVSLDGFKEKSSNITSAGNKVTQYTNGMNQLVTVTQKGSGATATYSAKVKTLNTQVQQSTKHIKNAAFATENWSYNWAKAMQSFLTYNTVTQLFNTIMNSIHDMIDQVKELDDALVELKKVTDLEGESLNRFVDDAYAAGHTVAKTGTEMIEAATAFAKAGYKDEALELGTVAAMYTNIADEAIDAADAADMIIAQMKAFNITADDSMHIIDAINEVSNNFAVSSADISRNLGKASAVMANAGNSMEQYIGLMTAATEVTRNASKAANGLKTLTLRLQGMNEEGEKDLEVQAQMEGLFNKLGISVYKSNGELKNTYEILETLAPIYKELTNAEKAYVTETIAGKYQAQNAAAILNNWQTAVDATTTAMESQGSAAAENEKVLDSIQGHLQQLTSSLEELSKNVFNSDLIKFIIDLGNAFLKLANNNVVQGIAKIAISLAAVNIAMKVFDTARTKVMLFTNGITKNTAALLMNTMAETKLNSATKKEIIQLLASKGAIDKNTKSISKKTKAEIAAKLSAAGLTKEEQKAVLASMNQVTANGLLSTSTFSLKGAWDALTASIAANPIGAILVAVTATASLISSLVSSSQQKAEEQREKLSELNSENLNKYEEATALLDEQKESVEELRNELADNNITQEEAIKVKQQLNDIQDKLIEKYGKEAEGIDLVNGKLDEEIEKIEKLKKTEAERYLVENASNLEKGHRVDLKQNMLGANLVGVSGANEDFIRGLINDTGGWSKAWNDDFSNNKTYAQWFYNQILDKIEEYNTQYNKALNDGDKDLADKIKKKMDELSSYSTDIKKQSDESVKLFDKTVDAYITTNDGLKDAYDRIKSGDVTSDAIGDAWDEIEKMKEDGKISDQWGEAVYGYLLDLHRKNWEEIGKQNEKAAYDSLDQYQKGAKGREESNKGTVIDTLFSDMENKSDALKNMYSQLKDVADGEALTAEQTTQIINAFDEFEIVNGNLVDSMGNVTGSLDEILLYFNGVNAETAKADDLITGYSTKLDGITAQYNTLTAAVDEYNEAGYLSSETLKKIMDGDLLQYLSYENGQLVANTSELYNNAESARIAASQKLYNAMADDIWAVSEGKLENASSLAQTAVKNLGNSAETSGNQAATATGKFINFAEAVDLANKALDGKELSSDVKKNIKAVEDAYKPYFDLLSKPINIEKKKYSGSGGSGSGGSSSSKSSKEWWEEQLDNLKDQYDNNEITINEYINSLQNLLGKVGQGTDAWKKINKELQKQKLDKIKDDYNAGRISLNQYIISLQNLQKEYKQSTKEWNTLADAIKKAKLDQLKEQQNDLKSALSAVNDVLDKQIDEYKDLKEAADDRYDDELDKLKDLKDELEDSNDDYERAQRAVVQFLNEQLDAIEEQRDTVENYYDDVIDAIEKMNEDTKESIELAEAYEALMNAMTQKTKKVYKEGLGWVWTTDAEAIKEAKKTYDDLINSATTKEIEEQKDKTVKSLEEQIESLQNYIDSWDKVFDKFDNEKNRNLADILLGENWSEMVSNLDPQIVDDFSDAYYELQKNLEETEKQIEELNKQKEEEDEYWDKLIKDLQDYKGEWADVASVYEEAQNALKARQIIGANWEKEILDRRLDVLENFKNKYNAILAEIDKVDNMSTDQASGYTALRLPGYANGGEVDYTGLAVLHGTPNKPEYVLNNSQMRNLLGNLTKPRTTSIINNKNGAVVNNYSFGNIELPNVTNAQQFANELKSMLNITKNQ